MRTWSMQPIFCSGNRSIRPWPRARVGSEVATYQDAAAPSDHCAGWRQCGCRCGPAATSSESSSVAALPRSAANFRPPSDILPPAAPGFLIRRSVRPLSSLSHHHGPIPAACADRSHGPARGGGLRLGRVWGMLSTARSGAWPPSGRSSSAKSRPSKAVTISTDCRSRSRRNEARCTGRRSRYRPAGGLG